MLLFLVLLIAVWFPLSFASGLLQFGLWIPPALLKENERQSSIIRCNWVTALLLRQMEAVPCAEFIETCFAERCNMGAARVTCHYSHKALGTSSENVQNPLSLIDHLVGPLNHCWVHQRLFIRRKICPNHLHRFCGRRRLDDGPGSLFDKKVIGMRATCPVTNVLAGLDQMFEFVIIIQLMRIPGCDQQLLEVENCRNSYVL